MKHSILNKTLLAIPASLALNLFAATDSLADSGIVCDIDYCSIEIHSSLSISAAVDHFYREADGRYEMAGDLIVTTPAGSVDLLDADLIFQQNPEGSEIAYEVYGTAKAPFPAIPLLGNGSASARPVAAVGLVGRDTLQSLLASGQKPLPLAENPKDPEGDPTDIKQPAYLFFHFASGLSFDIPLNQLLNSDNENFGFSVPGDRSITLVFDPQEPYFYLSSDSLFDFKEGMQQAMQWAEQENSEKNLPADSTDNTSASDLIDKIPLPQLNQLAWSSEGGIPLRMETIWGLPNVVGNIKGHLFVDAAMPLYKFFELNGEIVTSIGKEGYTQAGNGDLAVNFDLIPNLLHFNFNLARASAGVVVNADEQTGFFSGIKKPDTSFLPDWVPIKPTHETQLSGYISSASPHLSYLRAKGQFGFSPKFLSNLIGVELNDIVLNQSEMRIGAAGIWLKGKTSASIHPAIKLNKSTDVEIYLPFANLADTSIKMSGEIMVLGTGISPATLEISKQGFYINGQFSTPLAVIGLSGEISGSGPALAGVSKIMLPLDKITNALSDAQYAVAVARDKVNDIQRLIDVEIAAVVERRERHAQNLQTAQDALSAAQYEVNRIQSAINYQYDLISTYRKQITNKYNWYKSQPWYKKTWAWGVYSAYKTYKYGQISVAYTAIGALEATKLTAVAALEVAKYALKLLEAATETFPVEMDPKVAALIVSKEAANLVLLSAEEVLKRFPVIDFNAGTDLLLSLNNSGLHGEVSMIVNDRNLVGGNVTFDPVPKACIELAVVGELCTPF
ncbi:hypothetical protein [Methylomarinum vadi]|uniref:hypothetical protein n=1 Tax=Methylomarinum vadi TaxID=438855 RepID=UPI0004DECD4C|nr:hypothetical protein [Methylomarinum vadi]